ALPICACGELRFVEVAQREIELGAEELRTLLGIGQIDANLADVRIAQEVGMNFVRGFREQQNADIQSADVVAGRPFEESNQRHALVERGTMVTRGNDFLRKIDDERDASVPLRFLVAAGEESAEKRGELEKLARRAVS